MKCIINCRTTGAQWIEDYFPQSSAYMLRIANKSLLEYFVDFCELIGVDQVRIVMDEPNMEVEEFFNDGSRWGENISYSISRASDSIDEIIHKNSSFIDNEDLLIIDGPIFIWYDKENINMDFQKTHRLISIINVDSGSVMYIKSGHFKKGIDVSDAQSATAKLCISPITNIKQCFDLNFDVLKNHRNRFVLPGYNNEPGIHIGQNVEIPQNVQINKPVIIGDNVRFKSGAIIGPNAIIGSNSLVDSSTIITDSIVGDGTYVGMDLEINHKIVCRELLIDPISGEKVNVHDHLLISELNPHLLYSLLHRSLHHILAVLLTILMIVPFFLFSFVSILSGIIFFEWGDYITSKRCDVAPFWTLKMNKPSTLLNVYHRLSLDKFPLLLRVPVGTIYLSGNTLLKSSDSNNELIRSMNIYHPAVFTYNDYVSDGQERAEFEQNINELYYSSNSSIWLDCKIVFVCIFKRLIHGR